MPNYSLVMDSTFQPMSLERMLQPFQLYGQMYKEQQDALTDLDTKASIWEGLANKETDKKTYEQYSRYARDLRAQADKIATQGLDVNSRQAMKDLQGRYSKEITPIEQAYQRRAEQIAEQRKAGNSMIYDYDASTTSLDKFLEDPSKSYQSINRAELTNRAMTEFGTYAKALESYGKGDTIDKYHNTFIQKHGITREQAADFINKVNAGDMQGAMSSEVGKSLGSIYNNLYNGTNVDSWRNVDSSNKVRSAILEGVNAAIGQTQVSPITNEEQKYRDQLSLIRAKASAAGGGSTPSSTVLINRPGKQNQTKEQRTLAGKIARFNELRDEIKGNPNIMLSSTPKGLTASNAYDRSYRPTKQELIQREYSAKKDEFERLAKELTVELKRAYPNEKIKIDYSVTPSQSYLPGMLQPITSYSFNFDSNVDQYLNNLATISRGYNFNMTSGAMSQLANQIPLNTNVYGDNKVNDYITADNGSKVKNKDLQDVKWDKVVIYNEDGKNKFDWDGKTYVLKPGALGADDEAYWNPDASTGYRGLTEMWNSGDYDSYQKAYTNYANHMYTLYNTQAPGQSNTSSEIPTFD